MLLRHLLTASRPSDEDTRFKHNVNAGFHAALFGLAVLGWWILRRWWFPEFNPWSFWNLNGSFWASIGSVILPLIIIGIALGQLDWLSDDYGEEGTIVSENILYKGFIAVNAGLWEELNHRCILLFYGLIAILGLNTMLGWALPGEPIHRINAFWLHAYRWTAETPWRTLGVIGPMALIAVYFTTWLVRLNHPDYTPSHGLQLGRTVLFTAWAIYAMPRGVQAFDHIPFTLGERPDATLLAAGAVLWSNAQFREGHRYQGPAGMLNAYVFGLYMFAIAFRYGLLYAIVAHFVYDLVLFSSEHAVQVVKNWRQRRW